MTEKAGTEDASPTHETSGSYSRPFREAKLSMKKERTQSITRNDVLSSV